MGSGFLDGQRYQGEVIKVALVADPAIGRADLSKLPALEVAVMEYLREGGDVLVFRYPSPTNTDRHLNVTKAIVPSLKNHVIRYQSKPTSMQLGLGGD